MRRALIVIALMIMIVAPTAIARAATAGAAGCAVSGVAVGAGPQAVAAAQSGTAVPTIDRANLTANTQTATQQTELTTKECILDGLVVAIREALIASITQSIVDWINNGFEGGPAFITNLKGFLGQVADNTSLNFINGTELGFLCSPFQLQVRIALALQQKPFQQQIQCSLGNVSDNIDAFLKGDMSHGGLPAWLSMAVNTQNNPYGAYLMASAELQGRQTEAINRQLTQLGWSHGILSSGSCQDTNGVLDAADAAGIPNDGKLPTTEAACDAISGTWIVKTPGEVINNQLNQALGTGERQLELADEIDEIINALLAQLAQKALTSLGGLTGLSSGSSSNPSYLNQVVSQTQSGAVTAGATNIAIEVGNAITTENGYQGEVTNALAVLGSEKDFLNVRYQCYLNAGGNASVPNMTEALTTLATIVPKVKQYQNQLAVSTNTVKALNQLQASIEISGTADQLNALGGQYDALVQSGALHSDTDTSLVAADADQQQAALDAFKAETGDQCLVTTQI